MLAGWLGTVLEVEGGVVAVLGVGKGFLISRRIAYSSMGSGTSRHSGLCWGGRRGLSRRTWRRLLLSFCFGGNIGVESSRSEVNGGSEW